MTVKELKQQLENLPDDMVAMVNIFTDCDYYQPIGELSTNNVYVPEGDNYGYIYSSDSTTREVGLQQEEWDDLLNKPRVLVFIPIGECNNTNNKI